MFSTTLSIYLSINLIDIIGEYSDSKTYQTLIQIDPTVFNQKKLKNNLTQNISLSYLEKINFAYSEAAEFIRSEYNNRKVDLEDVTNVILSADWKSVDEVDYNLLYNLIGSRINHSLEKLKGLTKIWDNISIDQEGKIDQNLNNFAYSLYTQHHFILIKVWRKFVQLTPGVYETSHPKLYENQLTPYLKDEIIDIMNKRINV